MSMHFLLTNHELDAVAAAAHQTFTTAVESKGADRVMGHPDHVLSMAVRGETGRSAAAALPRPAVGEAFRNQREGAVPAAAQGAGAARAAPRPAAPPVPDPSRRPIPRRPDGRSAGTRQSARKPTSRGGQSSAMSPNQNDGEPLRPERSVCCALGRNRLLYLDSNS